MDKKNNNKFNVRIISFSPRLKLEKLESSKKQITTSRLDKFSEAFSLKGVPRTEKIRLDKNCLGLFTGLDKFPIRKKI